MLDIRYIRDNAGRVQAAADQKGYKVDIAHLLKLDDTRRELLTKTEDLRRERNELSAGFSGKPTLEQLERGKQLKQELATLDEQLHAAEESFISVLKTIPNVPYGDVPVGASEGENVVVSEWGEKPTFNFEPKNHWQIAEARGWIDKERAAKVAGSRFAYIKGDLVRLHWALIQWALDQLMDETVIAAIIKERNLQLSTKPFTPVLPPLMIKTDIYDAMDRLEPRDDRYKIDSEELWLQGSAEHVLGSMHANEIIDEQQVPIRYAGYATSFRREAGSYGKDMEGIFRLHQFDKLEMESLTTPETSFDEHLLLIGLQEHLIRIFHNEHLLLIGLQEHLIRSLHIPYRLINKCTYDIGKPNARGWDLEAWLPGQGKYRETHTADYMTDYQARRLQTRVRRADGAVELAHTNDATALSQRPLVAIIENFQTEDRHVVVPAVLRPYLAGKQTL